MSTPYVPYDNSKLPALDAQRISDAISALGDLEIATHERDEADRRCRAAEERLIEACGGRREGADSLSNAMWVLPHLGDDDGRGPLYHETAADECRLLLAPWLAKREDAPAPKEGRPGPAERAFIAHCDTCPLGCGVDYQQGRCRDGDLLGASMDAEIAGAPAEEVAP